MKRLEGYENVGNVLHILAEFHRGLAGFFENTGKAVTDERMRMMLAHLVKHQRQRAVALENYQRDAPATLLKSWLQIPFPENPGSFLESLGEQNGMTVEALQQLLSRVDGFVSQLLHHLETRAESANVEALFHDLHEIDNRERLLRSRALSSFSQI